MNSKISLIIFFIFLTGCATTGKNQIILTAGEKQEKINKCLNKGVKYYQNNKFTKARQEFEKFFSLMNIKAKIEFEELSDMASYQEILKEYIDKIEPELLNRTSSIQAIYAQGLALYEIGQYKPSIEYFAKVLVLEPDYKDTIKYIIQANMEIRKIKEAAEKKRLEKEKERKIKEEKKKFKKYYADGLNFYNKNRMEKAIVEFRKVLEIKPEHEKARKYFDKISIQLFDKAKEYYKEGLTVYGDGDIEQAIQLWEKALKLAPDYPQVQKALERAKAKIKK